MDGTGRQETESTVCQYEPEDVPGLPGGGVHLRQGLGQQSQGCVEENKVQGQHDGMFPHFSLACVPSSI